MIISEGNFLQIAMRYYNNSSMNTIEEFNQDLNRSRLIQRQFKKYKVSGKINARLLINHLICFTNVFGSVSEKLLKYIIDEEYHKQLYALLFVFNYVADLPIEVDEYLVELISKEIK